MAAGAIALGEPPSVDNMVSELPDNIFEGTPPADDSGSDDTSTADDGATDDTLGDVEDVDFEAAPAADAPPAPPTPEPTQEEPEPEPAAAAPKPGATEDEDLPDGVKYGKNRKGEDTAFVKKSRWDETIYPAYKLTQEAALAIGEPLTLEAIQTRDKALQLNDSFFRDLNSADPGLQGNVLDYVFREMGEALKAGETGSDPAVAFAGTFVDKLQAHSEAGYQALRLKTAQALTNELYEFAAKANDLNLFHGVGHVVRFLAGLDSNEKRPAAIAAATEKLGLPFHVASKMKDLASASTSGRPAGGDSALRRELDELRAKVEGRTVQSQAEQYRTWKRGTDEAVDKSLLEQAITPALASVADAWKDFPNEYQELVVKRLNSQITDKLMENGAFKSRIQGLMAQAKRATSDAVRTNLTTQIKTEFVNRAKMLATTKAIRGPILEFASTWLASRGNRQHERREAAQTRTTARGAPAAVPRSVIPKALTEMLGDTYDADAAFRQGMALIEGR